MLSPRNQGARLWQFVRNANARRFREEDSEMKHLCRGVFAVVLFSATAAFGQNSGSIGGVIMDQTGAVVPSASVTMLNPDTGVPTKTTSLADGSYVVNNLAPGRYEVTAE